VHSLNVKTFIAVLQRHAVTSGLHVDYIMWFRLNVVFQPEKRGRNNLCEIQQQWLLLQNQLRLMLYIPVYMDLHVSIVINIVTFICLI